MNVFLGTLWLSINKIKPPYVFDWEHGIALLAMQGNQASSLPRGKSHGFSRIAVVTCGIFLSYRGDGNSKLVFVQRR